MGSIIGIICNSGYDGDDVVIVVMREWCENKYDYIILVFMFMILWFLYVYDIVMLWCYVLWCKYYNSIMIMMI